MMLSQCDGSRAPGTAGHVRPAYGPLQAWLNCVTTCVVGSLILLSSH
jgi:hypothetical protein